MQPPLGFDHGNNIEITEEKLEEEDRHIKSLNLPLHNEGT